MAKKNRTPEELAARYERRAGKAARKLSRARYAAAEMRHAAGMTGAPAASGPVPLPAPDAFDDHLLGKAAGGDGPSRELLRKRGTDGIYASYARHILAQATDPGLRAQAAGVLAALDDSFDPYGPMPRGTGGAW